jgi:serine/threonine protein kinase
MSTDKETIVKVSDFGLAKYVSAPSKDVNTTIAGTHRFMAPEVLLQTGYSTNADVRSLHSVVVTKVTAVFKSNEKNDLLVTYKR